MKPGSGPGSKPPRSSLAPHTPGSHQRFSPRARTTDSATGAFAERGELGCFVRALVVAAARPRPPGPVRPPPRRAFGASGIARSGLRLPRGRLRQAKSRFWAMKSAPNFSSASSPL